MHELNRMEHLSCEKCGSKMVTRNIVPDSSGTRSSQKDQFMKISQCLVCRYWRKYNEEIMEMAYD